MMLFAGLRALRTHVKTNLPFVGSVIDFDIIIEIGYAEELGQQLSMKQFFLLDLGSTSTIRRRLNKLVVQGIIYKMSAEKDARTTHLALSSATLKSLHHYAKNLRAFTDALA